MKNKYFAEAVGTMVLVLMGCGAAVMNGGATSVAAVLWVLVNSGCVPIGATTTGANSFAEENLIPAFFEGGAALSQLWLQENRSPELCNNGVISVTAPF